MASPLPPLQSTRLSVRGYGVHVRSGGPPGAAPLTFVHGMGVSGRYLVPTARRLARHHRVRVPDLPGFGQTSAGGHVLALEELVEVLGELLAGEGHPATLVANSFGCQVGVRLAAQRPTLVDRLILVGPTVDAAARSWLVQATRLMRDARHEPLSYAAVLVPDYLRAGPRRVLRTAAAALADPVEAHLPHVVAPTLIVRGERDPIAPAVWVNQMASLLPQGRVATVAGIGHAVNYAAPDQLAELVERFVTPSPFAHRTETEVADVVPD